MPRTPLTSPGFAGAEKKDKVKISFRSPGRPGGRDVKRMNSGSVGRRDKRTPKGSGEKEGGEVQGRGKF